jgi:hypothetical protein
MPYTDVMPLTAQSQHKKWRELTDYSQPLPTIQARAQLAAHVPDFELSIATTSWQTGSSESEAPTSVLDNDWLHSLQVMGVPVMSRSALDGWHKPNHLSFSNLLRGQTWIGPQNSARFSRAR